mmetsp:Transcript_19764/g.49722  ORF Transcript_19764/g.49722 Transcript_19764/m.49722 type:complete len:224 (-) Transcript_19764:1561-2232(-)
MSIICFSWSLRMKSGRVRSQDCTIGVHPRSVSGSRYTIPTRDTVAGEAYSRSRTSKSMVVTGESLMISPEFRHSFLLSSSTVFMFSIQIASTGPSKTTHWRRIFPSAPTGWDPLRTAMASTPSVHSWVFKSASPYNCPWVIDFGFITYCTTGMKSSFCPAIFSRVVASTSLIEVFPHGGKPTVISPWRTTIVSHSCTALFVNSLVGCSPKEVVTASNWVTRLP